MEEEPIKTLQYKAGRMTYNENSKLVSAIKYKGTLKVNKFSGGETSLVWTCKNPDKQEGFEVYVFPELGKVELSKQRDRVIIVFNTEDPENPEPTEFLWIQEKDQTKDKKIVEEINNLINEIIDEEDFEDIEDENQNLLGNNNNQNNNISGENSQLQQNQQQNQTHLNNDFVQQMMQQMQQMQQGGQQGQNQNLLQQMMQQQQKKQAPYLTQIFTQQYLEEISKDPDFQNCLISELPQGQQSVEYLLENLKSPQFQQSLESLDKALNQGEGSSVLLSLGLDADSFQTTVDGNKALYEALQRQADKEKK